MNMNKFEIELEDEYVELLYKLKLEMCKEYLTNDEFIRMLVIDLLTDTKD